MGGDRVGNSSSTNVGTNSAVASNQTNQHILSKTSLGGANQSQSAGFNNDRISK